MSFRYLIPYLQMAIARYEAKFARGAPFSKNFKTEYLGVTLIADLNDARCNFTVAGGVRVVVEKTGYIE